MLRWRLHRKLLVGLATVTVVALGVVGITGIGAATAPLTEDDLAQYEEEFLTLTRHVGGVIEIGTGDTPSMKGAIGAVERGELHGAELRRASRAWVERLSGLEGEVRGLDVPEALAPSQAGFLSAIESYVLLARTLGAAAGDDDPAAIDATLDRAVALGTQGDEQFDAAAAVIQDARRELGLGPSPDLPDPDGALPDGVEIYDPHELYPEDS